MATLHKKYSKLKSGAKAKKQREILSLFHVGKFKAAHLLPLPSHHLSPFRRRRDSLGKDMEDFRSKSYDDGRMEGSYGSWATQPSGFQGLRSYSASYAQANHDPREAKFEKGKNTSATSSSSSKGGWGFSDPEMQRKKRVAGYKVYAVEGKMKGSLRKRFRWIKDRCTQAVHEWW